MAALRAPAAAAGHQPPRLGRVCRRAHGARRAAPRARRFAAPVGHGLQRRSASARHHARRRCRRVTETVPYGVDVGRFAPTPTARLAIRARARRWTTRPLVFAAGRLVSKKGFEYLIDAAAALQRASPALQVSIAGDGDLRATLDGASRGERRIQSACSAIDRRTTSPARRGGGRHRRALGTRRRGQRRRPAELRARGAGHRHAGRGHVARRACRRRSRTERRAVLVPPSAIPRRWPRRSASCSRNPIAARTLGEAARATRRSRPTAGPASPSGSKRFTRQLQNGDAADMPFERAF